jgi:hypothetical protein
MAQHDYDIANQSFPSFRSDLNSVLEAINTSNSGTSRPTSAVAGTVWLDVTNATNPTLKFFDGTDDISLAQFDYSANTVNWLDSTVVADFNLVDDTTPQLGGNLDVNGNSIVSVSNGNITFTPDGTGKVIIDGLSYPTSDGTADQVLKTDGAGNLSFGDAGGGGTQWQSSIKTSAFTAVAGEGYWINTTSSAVTVTLPASASVGDTIEFSDYAGTWGTNAVTLNTNSLNFQGNTTDSNSAYPIYNTNNQSVTIVYSGATQGWIPTSDDNVSIETPQFITTEYLVIAGGGGGGKIQSKGGGGGGAGGYRNSYASETSGGGASTETPAELIQGETYTITVGAGGSTGVNGEDSSIIGKDVSVISIGGGAGGGSVGQDGGSGGGGAVIYNNNDFTGGFATANQGYNGADGNRTLGASAGGGGGGAGEVGDTNGDSTGGDGLSSSITGSAVTRGGGGAGQFDQTVKSGGTGGGGNGAKADSATNATAGTANTGGGGGGGNQSGAGSPASGGSGVVILRLPTADYSGTTTGSPTVTTSGSDTILIYNSSGSYTA